MQYNNRAGRPSKAYQFEIEKLLWPYFEHHESVQKASKETKLNRKTVQKYFRVWQQKYLDSQGTEFFKKCRIANGRAILELKEIKLKLENISNRLESQINSLNGNFAQDKKWIFVEYNRIKIAIADLVVKINNLENSPTADITLENEIQKIVREIGENNCKISVENPMDLSMRKEG